MHIASCACLQLSLLAILEEGTSAATPLTINHPVANIYHTRMIALYILTSDGVVHAEAVLAVRAEAAMHLSQLLAHKLRPFGGRPTPHVQVLEDRETT